MELFARQEDAARGLLAKPLVERLDFEGWTQTTRAVIASAFGEPSDNLDAHDRASPGYAPKIGQDERFWAQYRRDELEAKLAAVKSCVSQLEMGLGTARMSEFADHPYNAARKVLKFLYDIFLKYGHRNWSISPIKDGKENFASVGLDGDTARQALRLLVSKNLAKFMGTDAFVITDYGVSACDHPDVLERELPIGRGDTGAVGERQSTNADLGALANVGDLLEDEDIRNIIARDIMELKVAANFGLAKSTLLLGGSVLEGILADVLDRNRAVASSYLKKRRFPEEASLQDLIRIAGDPAIVDSPRHLLTATSIALANAVTDHRDLIHPHAEARGHIRVDNTTAQSIVHLLSVVVRDLLEAKERGDIAAYADK
jgi:hypothetical protein